MSQGRTASGRRLPSHRLAVLFAAWLCACGEFAPPQPFADAAPGGADVYPEPVDIGPLPGVDGAGAPCTIVALGEGGDEISAGVEPGGTVRLPDAVVNWSAVDHVRFQVRQAGQPLAGSVAWQVLGEAAVVDDLGRHLDGQSEPGTAFLSGPFYNEGVYVFSLRAESAQAPGAVCTSPDYLLYVRSPCSAALPSCDYLPGGPRLSCDPTIPACVLAAKAGQCALPTDRLFFRLTGLTGKLRRFSATVEADAPAGAEASFGEPAAGTPAARRLALRTKAGESVELTYRLDGDAPLPVAMGGSYRFVYGDWGSASDGDGYLMVFAQDTPELVFLGHAGGMPPGRLVDLCTAEAGAAGATACQSLALMLVASSCGPLGHANCEARPSALLVASAGAEPRALFAGQSTPVGAAGDYELRLLSAEQVLCDATNAPAPVSRPAAWLSYRLQRRTPVAE